MENEKSKKAFENSEPTVGTIFRSKIFVADEFGKRFSKYATAVRAEPKLSKLQKKILKKVKVKLLKVCK